MLPSLRVGGARASIPTRPRVLTGGTEWHLGSNPAPDGPSALPTAHVLIQEGGHSH